MDGGRANCGVSARERDSDDDRSAAGVSAAMSHDRRSCERPTEALQRQDDESTTAWGSMAVRLGLVAVLLLFAIIFGALIVPLIS